MKTLPLLLLSLLTLSATAAESGVKRYLYLSTPDGAQTEGRSSEGILIFDIDNGHRFVRRITIPIFKEGLRGFVGNATTHAVYYTTTSRRMGCFDLESEKIVWDRTYDAGCDRACITPDGTKIYVPTGWWYRGDDSGFLVVDAKDGTLLKRIRVNVQAHNSLFVFDATVMPPKEKTHVDLSMGGHGWVTFSLDGRYAWAHTPDVIDVRTKKVVATLKDENGQPFASSKFIEVHLRNGKVVRVGDQFGLGRVHVAGNL
ncbi:MAG: hypothetical protein FJ398_18185 [Verrucomicrobia bacterium]|nr:hypothetical protein [Verrucomicrobiota bacterium]